MYTIEHMKKKFSYILIVAVFLSVMIPKQSHAQMAVAELGGNLFTNIMNTVETVWNSAVVKMLEPAVKTLADKLLDKVINKSLNWAFGGLDDEPGFVNNYGDFIKGTKYDEIIDWYDQSIQISGVPQSSGTPGQIAQQNYASQTSDSFKLKRAATRAIALYGKENLGKSKLAQTISLQNETISGLLGGDSGVQNFKGDFKEGGWGAYLALLNPNNTELGITSLVKSQIESEVTNEVDQKVTNLQTPLKFLDKVECLEYKANATTGEQVCVKEKTTTPAEQVSEKVNKAIVKDENKAEQSEGLIATLLRSAVGKLTDGIINRGLSKIGNGAGGFYDANQDVFNNGSIDAQFGFNNSSAGASNNNPAAGYIPGSASPTYIGGPEDQLDYGQGGAQLIIDLEAELEIMIAAAAKEQEYFNSIKIIKKENEDTIIGLDKCVPGPDSGWEARFKDLPTEGGQVMTLAFTRTKEMFADPKTNIPGAGEMVSTIDLIMKGINQDNAQNQQRIQALTRVVSNLNYIHDEVLSGFNAKKQDNNPNLVVFTKEWDQLTTAQKENAFAYAVNNQYSVLAPGETPASVVATNPNKAKTAVLRAGWQIWVDETDPQAKSDLRYSYFIVQNDLATEETIARARANAASIENSAVRAKQLLRDCLVLRAYSLGMSDTAIQNITSSGDVSSLAQINLQVTQFTNNSLFGSLPGGGGVLGGLFGGGSGGSNPFAFLDTSSARDDTVIKTFLVNERTKQQNNLPSVFLTNTVTSNVTNSILGFNSQLERDNYFNTLYSDAELTKPYIKNAKSLSELYKADTFMYLGKEVGVLYCRHPEKKHIVSPIAGGTLESVCLYPWYKSSKLNYAVAFSGI